MNTTQSIAEVLLTQLPSIIFAAAALMASIATLVSVIKGQGKIDHIAQKVDGGMTALQTALAEIAKQSAATAKTVIVKEGQRATNGRRNEP